MMLSEGAKETPSCDLVVADGFVAVFIEPTSTPVTQITYDGGTAYVSDTSSGENVHGRKPFISAPITPTEKSNQRVISYSSEF
jgi:hypothetical protein